MTEWETIPGYLNYEASKSGKIRNARNGYQLKDYAHTRGYRTIILGFGSRLELKHRLIARTFLGPCPEKHEVNHKNGKKDDNRLDNLEYLTHSQNIKHGYNLGTSRSLVTGMIVRRIFTLRRRGLFQKDIAKLVGFDQTTVSRILRTKRHDGNLGVMSANLIPKELRGPILERVATYNE